MKQMNSDFKKGSLRVVSYARPGKLFTANQALLISEVGVLNEQGVRERAQRGDRYSAPITEVARRKPRPVPTW